MIRIHRDDLPAKIEVLNNKLKNLEVEYSKEFEVENKIYIEKMKTYENRSLLYKILSSDSELRIWANRPFHKLNDYPFELRPIEYKKLIEIKKDILDFLNKTSGTFYYTEQEIEDDRRT